MIAGTKSKHPNLLERFKASTSSDFPSGMDYLARFGAIESYLTENVHPAVTVGASFADGGFLTDHGPLHVRTVIERASALLQSSDYTGLTNYEIYLLLAAIHVHDVGNMSGRSEHELGSADLMQKLGALFGSDDVEKRTIYKIAQAHGGRVGLDKDKISKLQETEYLMGQTVRPRFLAALLRFADELADDRTRAQRQLIDGGLPLSSEVFHKFAYALHSVLVVGNSVRLSFEMTREDALSRFGKYANSVYLLDEIYERMLKMHAERIYCMRFLRPAISIDQIDVSIKVFGPRFADDPLANIDFRLEEAGYPSLSSTDILNFCPELAAHACGSPPTGLSLNAFLGGSDEE
jgi:hypothetical protein